MYWFSASFARLVGAGYFGYGFLLWAVHGLLTADSIPTEKSRRVVLALLLSNIIGLFVAITQQLQVWVNLAGWITILIYAILTLGYSIFLVRGKS